MAIRHKLKDKLITLLMVMALPETMEVLKTVLYNTKGPDLTTDSVKHQILLDEQHCICAFGGITSTYFVKATKKFGQSTKGKSEEPNKKTCSNCKKSGHWKVECHKLKKDKEEKAAKATNSNASSSNSTPGTQSANLACTPAEDVIYLFHMTTTNPS